MVSRRICIVLAALLAVFSVSLSGGAAQPVPPDADPAAASPRSVITLLDAGQGELRALRWTPRVGVPVRARLSMQMRMDLAFDGQAMPSSPLPTIVFTMRVEAGEANAEGNFPITTTYESIGLEGETNPMMRRALLDAMRPLEGATLAFEMTPLGVISSTNTSELPPRVLEMLGGQNGARQMIESIAQPMPAQPVGVGARWRLVQRMGGVNSPVITTTATYEMVRRDGDRVELRMTGRQTGEPQEFDLPAPDATAQLLSASGESTGSSTIELDTLVPIRAETSGRTTFKYEFTERGITQVVDQTVGVDLEIERIENEQEDASEPG